MLFNKQRFSVLKVGLLSVFCGFHPLSLSDESPYNFEVVYTADYLENIDGGIKKGAAYLDNFDVLFDLDAEKLWGIDGGSFHFHILHNNNKTFSDIVGDAQVISNIDNSSVLRLYEFWWQQNIGNHSVKIGLFDLNSEFDAIDPAGLFLSSSHGIGPDYSQSGENGPSIFPTTSLSFRYNYQFNDDFHIQAAILDGVPGDPDDPQKNTINVSSTDLLIALEANYQVGKTRYGVGTWYYTKETEQLNGMAMDNNAGIYGIVHHQFLNEEDNGRTLNGWLRVGRADAEINQFGSYIGGGVVLSNFIASRPDDSLGFAVAQVRNGAKFRALNPTAESDETAFELTYNAPLNKHLTIQPDIQYIINPGTDPLLDNALVIGIRFELSLL